MLHRQCQGVQWLEFELLADCPVVHGCLMRHGGISTGVLNSLNLGRKVGDAPENVKANHLKVASALSVPAMLSAKLCHGDRVTAIPSATFEIPVSDALSTQIPNLGIMVSQADCQAAIFYDPVRHAMANVHCGWRGSVQNIYLKTVSHMQQAYGCKAADLLVCISPSLGPESAEFINYRQELPEAFWEFQPKPCYFDFWSISEWQLRQSGVLAHHIQVAGIDTYARTEDYFSYRRSNACGRQATVCSLR